MGGHRSNAKGKWRNEPCRHRAGMHVSTNETITPIRRSFSEVRPNARNTRDQQVTIPMLRLVPDSGLTTNSAVSRFRPRPSRFRGASGRARTNTERTITARHGFAHEFAQRLFGPRKGAASTTRVQPQRQRARPTRTKARSPLGRRKLPTSEALAPTVLASDPWHVTLTKPLSASTGTPT